jgi:glycine/D-amino acid oxidase-like deaminating enzyme/nitrite reductase/ring-hydroxylating ferredoxin subunit
VQAPRINRPLWLEEADTAYPSLAGAIDVDVAVIGGGITGLTTAHLLKRAGRTVALVEMNRIGYGATGYTTAKLTVGHGLVYRRLTDEHGEETARRYARSNQDAIGLVAAIVAEHRIDCDFERASNYVYVENGESAAELEREAEAAGRAGVAADLTTETDLPYPVAAALRVDDQAQLHPWKYLAALAAVVDGDGSHVFELTRATDVRSGDPCVVETTSGSVRASHVVVATQLPFLDRGLHFARAHPAVSSLVAAPIAAGEAPRGMYISADQPTRSVRSTPGEDGQRLVLVGGGDGYDALEGFMRERFGIDGAPFRWSTHDYVPVDGLPFIGRIRLGEERILVATGFAKWGMTKGTLAGRILADTILGRATADAELYDAARLGLTHGLGRFARGNAEVGAQFVADRVRRWDGREAVDRLEAGGGAVVRVGGRLFAVHRDDGGVLHVLSARCTHLGCIVHWSADDRAWGCPCHGSRFAADGTLVQGPAVRDLPRRALPDPE